MESDNQLIINARQGDEVALEKLMNEYKSLVNKISRNYFIIGADFEDVIQEGMIGLFNAYNTFDQTKNASFKTYATILINRQIINAIKKAYKYNNLDFFSDLNAKELEDDIEIFNPEEFIINKESHSTLLKEISTKLSPLEISILQEFLKNETYEEIAKKLNLNKKSVDNALSRIKKKLNYLIK